LLSAADHRPAYRGDFTRTLIETLHRGITSAGATIDASDLREPLQVGAQKQRPQRVTIDGGGWAHRGDQGLWLAYNSALYSPDDNAASVAAQARVGELTDYLPTDTLDALVIAAREHQCVMLTGAAAARALNVLKAAAQGANVEQAPLGEVT
jgi:hypothetical protein